MASFTRRSRSLSLRAWMQRKWTGRGGGGGAHEVGHNWGAGRQKWALGGGEMKRYALRLPLPLPRWHWRAAAEAATAPPQSLGPALLFRGAAVVGAACCRAAHEASSPGEPRGAGHPRLAAAAPGGCAARQGGRGGGGGEWQGRQQAADAALPGSTLVPARPAGPWLDARRAQQTSLRLHLEALPGTAGAPRRKDSRHSAASQPDTPLGGPFRHSRRAATQGQQAQRSAPATPRGAPP